MAKHVGERARPRPRALPRRLPRGLAWGLGAFTLVVRAHRRGRGPRRRDPRSRRPERGHLRHPPGADAVPCADADCEARSRSSTQAQATATRRPDLSRHAVRPPVAPYHVKSGPTLALKPKVVLARKVADLSPATSTFTIAQSNILGSQHTRGNDGFAPGTSPCRDDGQPADVSRRRRRRDAGGAGGPAPRAAGPDGRLLDLARLPALGNNGVRNCRSTGATRSSRWRTAARPPTPSPTSASRFPTSCSATARRARSSG